MKLPYQLEREILPLMIIVIILGVLSLPMVRGYGAVMGISSRLNAQREQWNTTSMDTLAQRIGDSPVVFDDGLDAQLALTDPGLRSLSSFSPDLRRDVEALEQLIESAVATHATKDAAAWLAVMQDVDRAFTRVLAGLQDIEAQRNRAYRSLLFFFVLLILTFLVLYGYQTVRVGALAQEQKLRLRFTELTRKVQEEERRAISRELHDGTAQELAIARMAADRISDESTRRMIQQSLTRAIAEVRFLSHQLRPVQELHSSPARMLAELVRFYEGRHSLQFHLDLDSAITLDWPDEQMVHLYRIAQEAITNVVRHADARTVRIVLGIPGERLLLVVEDDGTGLVGSRPDLGQTGMTERAELLGGSVEWSSAEGIGTAMRLDVPLHHRTGRPA